MSVDVVADALRESEERFHALADNIPNLAWMANPTAGFSGTTSNGMIIRELRRRRCRDGDGKRYTTRITSNR